MKYEAVRFPTFTETQCLHLQWSKRSMKNGRILLCLLVYPVAVASYPTRTESLNRDATLSTGLACIKNFSSRFIVTVLYMGAAIDLSSGAAWFESRLDCQLSWFRLLWYSSVQIPWKIWNVVLHKDGEVQFERSCDKKCYSQGGMELRMYSKKK